MKRILVTLSTLLLATRFAHSEETVRVGYFPNITHAQALVGLANGEFQKALGTNTRIDAKAFTAGPSAIEALFAGAIDLTYIGPGPAINGYVKSDGALVIIAGACSGGASLIVRQDAGIKTATDLHGKKMATPQLGNTQDIAARVYLKKNGLTLIERGGDVQILPIANPDQLTLFLKKNLDAAWAPEPWATRLIEEGQGKLLLDERDLWPNRKFATTVLLVRKDYLAKHPDTVARWLKAHKTLTRWIQTHPAEAQKMVGQEIKRLTYKALPEAVLAQAWKRLEFTTDPLPASLETMGQGAYELGFLGSKKPDLSGLVQKIK